MFTKLGNNIIVAFALVLAAVLAVGGISMFSANAIMDNTHHIEEESKHIRIIDGIHASVYRLILSIHHFIIVHNPEYFEDANRLLKEIERKVQEYIKIEEAETYPEKEIEIRLLKEIEDNIGKIRGHSGWLVEEFSKTGRIDDRKLIDLENFAYNIESKVAEINKVHFDQISNRVKRSKESMGLILRLYIIFSVAGVISVVLGHILLSRKVVMPIQRLASATIELAEGNLSTRVAIDSRTEIGSLYRSFNIMAKKLEEHEKKLKDFNLITSGVNHEIRTALNPLSINVQLLRKEISKIDNPKAGNLLDTIAIVEHEINRINNVMEEFVRIAKFPHPRFRKEDINLIIKEVAELISPRAKESGVEVCLSLPNEIPLLMLDSEQMKQVILNLSVNAIQAMPDGGTLTIGTLKDGQKILIRVSDTGKGIPPEIMKDIFTPIFSTKEEGLGLGLSIAQRIVEAHGGKIMCRSEINKGAVFEIMIPLKI